MQIVIRVDIPALDRLVDYLTGGSNQPEIDAANQKIAALVSRLEQSSARLAGVQTSTP